MIYNFELGYKNNIIGVLTYHADLESWEFYYSKWFKNQNKIKPLFDFPEINKTYFSSKLFMMFKNRIPPPNRIDIKSERIKKGIGDDDISMIIHYGYKCITDPFTLTFNPILT